MSTNVARLAAMLLWFALAGGQPAQNAAVAGSVRARDVRVGGAVVYLVPSRDTSFAQPTEFSMIDQVNLRFVPPVLAILPGTTVEFRNSDAVLHNVFSPEAAGEGFDLGTYPRNDRRVHTFGSLGVHAILCHVHPEMVAYVVVIPTPYHAVVDPEGRFRINDVPAGPYMLYVWHRRAPPFEQAVMLRSGNTLRLELDLSRQDREERSS